MSFPHKGSLETYEFIANWIDPNFFFSRNDGWGRFGMLGVFVDYVLSCTQGDIAEIGVGESSIYLTSLAKKFKRNIYHCDISPSKITNPMTVPDYLSENGLYVEENRKISVNFPPSSSKCLFYAGASDSFFKEIRITPLAVAFIDGDHNYPQVHKDFWNFVPLLVPDGYVFLHDTYPPDEEHLSEHRCGTVFRLRQEIEKNDQFDCLTLPKGTAMGVGFTIVRKRPLNLPYWKERSK